MVENIECSFCGNIWNKKSLDLYGCCIECGNPYPYKEGSSPNADPWLEFKRRIAMEEIKIEKMKDMVYFKKTTLSIYDIKKIIKEVDDWIKFG